MQGKLYVVGTPIGNLDDFSPRAAQTLAAVDFIAAEDTRVTCKLLNRFSIKKPMVSYYEHNLRERGEAILARLLAGESCALVSDAGMPCVSDPGEDLVRLCAEHGIEVCAVPGPSAAITALCLSGLPTARFSFEGFLSTNKRSRANHLSEVKDQTNTLIFYEAPHKLLATLRDLLRVLGDRRIAVVKELTKLHESVNRTTLSAAVDLYEANPPKGEYVLVVAGAPAKTADEMTLADAVALAKSLMEDGLRAADAAKRAASLSGHKKADIYKALI